MSGLTAAAAASLYATTYNSHLTFNLLDWSDAQSVTDKIALAKALGVRGVALFEFDGGEDPAIWTVLQGVKNNRNEREAEFSLRSLDPKWSYPQKLPTSELGVGLFFFCIVYNRELCLKTQ